MKIKTLLLATALFLPLTTFAKTVTVVVPATASGNFGFPTDNAVTPMVKAITVTKATTIRIFYISGNWSGSSLLPLSDANGQNAFPGRDYGVYYQPPLFEANGVTGVESRNIMALIGAFIPKTLVDDPEFTPMDGTKKSNGVGIMPDKLFFIGSDNTIQTTGAGTLYLGVNDMTASDNSGALTIKITTP